MDNTIIFVTEPTNITNFTTVTEDNNENTIDVIMLLSTIIASVGIVSNSTVVVVFLKHKKMRRKIPNIFIINQVRDYFETSFSVRWP